MFQEVQGLTLGINYYFLPEDAQFLHFQEAGHGLLVTVLIDTDKPNVQGKLLLMTSYSALPEYEVQHLATAVVKKEAWHIFRVLDNGD